MEGAERRWAAGREGLTSRVGGVLGTRLWKNGASILSSLAVSSLLALALKPFLHNQAALLPFTLAVILASSYGGLWPGLIATILSFVIADVFFMEPLFQFLAIFP